MSNDHVICILVRFPRQNLHMKHIAKPLKSITASLLTMGQQRSSTVNGNPRNLTIRALLAVMLSIIIQRIKDWIHPTPGTPATFTASAAVLPDFVELCGVEATVYESGSTVLASRLLQTSGEWLWWFEDSSIKRLEDALSSGMKDGFSLPDEYRTMKCRAIRFELTPMFNPAYVYRHGMSGCVSAMDVEISQGQEYARYLFEEDESDSLQRMAVIAEQLAARDEYAHFMGIQFTGVFNVWYSENHDEDGGVSDVDISAAFIRAFEMEKALR